MRGLVMGIAIISASWPFIKALAQDDSDMPKERWGKTEDGHSRITARQRNSEIGLRDNCGPSWFRHRYGQAGQDNTPLIRYQM
ncbi:hypothetical protein ABH892_005509 [Paenibacillus sp. RC254]|uniref:hypothetical protein n=2 Tax=Paenibacillus TaxID=44249 RepID=UPI0038331463